MCPTSRQLPTIAADCHVAANLWNVVGCASLVLDIRISRTKPSQLFDLGSHLHPPNPAYRAPRRRAPYLRLKD